MPFSADNIRHQTMQSIFGNTQKYYLPQSGQTIVSLQEKGGDICERVPLSERTLISLGNRCSTWVQTIGDRPEKTTTLTAESRDVPVSNASVSGCLRARFVLVAASHSGEGRHFIKDRTNNHSRCGKLTRKGFVSHPPSTLTGLNKLGDEVCCLTVCQQNTRSGD